VKPHGALYNRAVWDSEQAEAIVAALCSYDTRLPLLSLPGSAAAKAAALAGVTSVAEAFADRAYNDDGTLVSRSQAGAVLTDSAAIATRSAKMMTAGTVQSISGGLVPIAARSICVHGDTPGAVGIAKSVRAALEQAGVALAPFA
jgi:UPF0271 protein